MEQPMQDCLNNLIYIPDNDGSHNKLLLAHQYSLIDAAALAESIIKMNKG